MNATACLFNQPVSKNDLATEKKLDFYDRGDHPHVMSAASAQTETEI